VKVWDTDELIDNLLSVFDRIDEDIASEIPLQRVWTLSNGVE
jgi:restriction system protein